MSDFYLIRKTTMDNIGDAIREKTEITTKINPVDMPERIRSIQSSSSDSGSGDSGNNPGGSYVPEDSISGSDGVIVDDTNYPDYVISGVESVVNTRNSHGVTNGLTFVAMSDMHEATENDITNSDTLATYRRANLNAGQAAKLISDKVPLDFFANLGDLGWISGSTIESDAVYSIARARVYTSAVERDNTCFIIPGNHDIDNANGFLDYKMVNFLIGIYKYRDFKDRKVRVIALNTADTSDKYESDNRISSAQLQWFVEALDLSSTYGSDASNWGVVILSHHPIDYSNTKPITDCLYHYLNGSTFTSGSVSYNFSGKNAAKIIGAFNGHTHNFKVAKLTSSYGTLAVNKIAIPNACYGRCNEYWESTAKNDFLGDPEYTHTRKDNDVTNTSLCLVTIDLDNKIIYADVYGSGKNRIINYEFGESVVVCNVTPPNSDNVIFDGALSVGKGLPYTASVSANTGCELISVKVTMGTDVTSSYYSNGQIDIPSVTGDIVITASATRVEFATFDITYNANNAVYRDIRSVKEEDSYTNNIRSASGDDKAVEVYVTMGGEDITSALNADGTPMYCNGTIDIKKVTGDIDISAAGYDVENLVRSSVSHTSTSVYNNVGYKNGIRLSETAPYDSELATHVTTGLIPYTWNSSNSLYIKGIDILSSDNQQEYSRLYGYKSDKVTIPNYARITFNPSAAETHSFVDNFIVEKLGDNYFKVTPVRDISASYIRISLYGKGENLIVTINEPIMSTDNGGNEPDEPVVPDTPLKNGIYEEDGSLYYYVDDVRTYAGIIEIDRYYYYANSSGEIIHGKSYWVSKTNGLIPEASYNFDEQGRITDIRPGDTDPDEPEETNVITITQQPQNINAVNSADGVSAVFTIDAISESGDTLSYNWQEQNGTNDPNDESSWKNAIALGSATEKTLTIKYSNFPYLPYEHRYRCIVSDSNGNQVISNYATLTVTKESTEEPVLNYRNYVSESTTSDGITIYGEDYDGDGKADGYKKNYRLNSSGGESSQSKSVCSGYIPYNGEVIRVWGTHDSSPGYTGNYIAFYADYPENNPELLPVSIAATNTHLITYTELNGKYLMTCDPINSSVELTKVTPSEAKYIRCGFGNCNESDYFVVTLDEEITFE